MSLGVAVGFGVAVGLGVAVSFGVAVGLGVAVGFGVAVGLGVGCCSTPTTPASPTPHRTQRQRNYQQQYSQKC